MARVVFTSQHATEAEIVSGLLRSNGLEPRVLGADTARLVGMGSHIAPVKVVVPPPQEEDAKRLLGTIIRYDDYGRLSFVDPTSVHGELSVAAGDSKGAEPTTCARCEETWEPGFEVCWNCEYELP